MGMQMIRAVALETGRVPGGLLQGRGEGLRLLLTEWLGSHLRTQAFEHGFFKIKDVSDGLGIEELKRTRYWEIACSGRWDWDRSPEGFRSVGDVFSLFLVSVRKPA